MSRVRLLVDMSMFYSDWIQIKEDDHLSRNVDDETYLILPYIGKCSRKESDFANF